MLLILILTRIAFSTYLIMMPFLFVRLILNKFYSSKRSINFLIPVFWIFMIFHEKGERFFNKKPTIGGTSMVKMIMMLLVLGLSVSCGFEIVDPGHRGVKVVLGEVQMKDGAYAEGIHFYNPFTTSIKELDVRETVAEIETMAYTKDMQNVQVTAKVNISLEPSAVPHVYQSIGEEWQSRLVNPVLSSKVKEVIGQFDAEKLVSDRRSATDGIRDLLKAELQDRNVLVANFELVNLDFNDQFEKAIEAKVVATQRALEAVNTTKQIEEEAKQKVIQATSEAEAMKIKTQALQQNKSLIEYEAVLRWNGKLPQYMMGNGAMPFINIGNKQ